MTYTRSQNYTNVVVSELGIQTFKVVVVVIICCFCPHKCTSLVIFGYGFAKIFLNVNFKSTALRRYE